MSKDKRITFAISEEQEEEWKQIADSQGRSLSAFIRYAVSIYIMFLKKSMKNIER